METNMLCPKCGNKLEAEIKLTDDSMNYIDIDFDCGEHQYFARITTDDLMEN